MCSVIVGIRKIFVFNVWQYQFELLISFALFEDSLLDKHNEESFFKYKFQNRVLVGIYLHRQGFSSAITINKTVKTIWKSKGIFKLFRILNAYLRSEGLRAQM